MARTSHFQHLLRLYPDLSQAWILDLGSGEGRFAIEAKAAGARVTGLEYYPGHIEVANALATRSGVAVPFIEGKGEAIPFPDESFDFINVAEVIEHVEDPDQVLREVFRVLRHNGQVYLSAPNRFGLRDPHYKLYLVNWLPRALADGIIAILGCGKDELEFKKGEQRLSEMHYYTYRGICHAARAAGFSCEDIRLRHISALPLPKRVVVRSAYLLMRPWYFDSFHLLLSKK